VEKVRDEAASMIAVRSAAPYFLNTSNMEKFFSSPPEQDSSFAMRLSKNLKQSLRYCMYGLAMNYLNDKVFTLRDVQPSDDVKPHLGLTGPNAGRSFMELSLHIFIVIIVIILIIFIRLNMIFV
jgi:hypothetical protein